MRDPVERRQANRVAVFSDVHLAAPGTPLSFAGDTAAFARWWESLLDDHDLVVVNGDLWDLERGARPFNTRSELLAARAAWPSVAELETHARVVVVAGNHDLHLKREGRPEAVEVELGGLVVRIEHGHRYDAPIKRLRGFTSLVTWASGRVAAGGLQEQVDQLRRVEALVTGERTFDGPIERGARSTLRERGDLAAMVVGHTHRPLLQRVDGAVLVNPGGCEGGVFRSCTLDGSLRRVENMECVSGHRRCVARGDLARSDRGATTGT